MAIPVEIKTEIRRYLLGQLDDESVERLEFRLISEPEVVEEFDVIVDEIIDDYVAGELSEVDRQNAEAHFLVAPERQEKLVVARALRSFVQKNRKPSEQTTGTIPPRRIPAYIWATALALFVVLGLVAAWTMMRERPTQTVALTLNITSSERGTATKPERISIDSNVGELRLSLRLPDNEQKSPNYRVELVSADGTTRDVPIDRVNDQFVTVNIETSTLAASSYALRLSAIDANRSERRLNGSYLFELVKS